MVLRARDEAQRPVGGVEVIEIGSEPHPLYAGPVVVVPACLGEVEHPLRLQRQRGNAEELFGGVHENGVVTDQRGADRGEPRGHGKIVAAYAVDDVFVVSGGIGVTEGRVDLGPKSVGPLGPEKPGRATKPKAGSSRSGVL